MLQYADICWIIYYYCYLLTCSKEKRLIVFIFIFTYFTAASITMDISIQLILFFLKSSPIIPPILQILTSSNTYHQHVILTQLHNINLGRIILLTKILFHAHKTLIKIWIKPSFIFVSIYLNITTKLYHEKYLLNVEEKIGLLEFYIYSTIYALFYYFYIFWLTSCSFFLYYVKLLFIWLFIFYGRFL